MADSHAYYQQHTYDRRAKSSQRADMYASITVLHNVTGPTVRGANRTEVVAWTAYKGCGLTEPEQHTFSRTDTSPAPLSGNTEEGL